MSRRPLKLVFVLLLCSSLACDRHPSTSGRVASPEGDRQANQSAEKRAEHTAHLEAEVSDQETTPQQILKQRQALDKTVLSHETEAQRHEQSFVQLWDGLLRSNDPFRVLAAFQFDSLTAGKPEEGSFLDAGVSGIRVRRVGAPHRQLNHAQYEVALEKLAEEGWSIEQTEWHHSKFEPRADRPANSIFSFEIHASQHSSRRVILRGKLRVTWSSKRNAQGFPMADSLDATDVLIIDRAASPIFSEVAVIDPKAVASGRNLRVSPLILYDVNHDGLSEIILAGCNRIYRNLGNNRFDGQPFLPSNTGPLAEAGIMADFTGDGIPDFVGAPLSELRLRMFPGSAGGIFTAPSWICSEDLLDNPHAMSAGDIDGDGDLDLFIGQWKQPYDRGSMPTPYYDANDGHPDYLLRNDGSGHFTDITKEANLARKRHRRSYSASLVDLDDDGDLDLLRVSDFAGIDLFVNDGAGHFRDVTNELVEEPHAFGMSHTLNDFDGDGQLDIYMIGMSSTTARRLDQLGISRLGREDNTRFRMKMAYGNRMYLGNGGQFVRPPFADRVARTGWSWGCTSSDFDNDGDVDIYVANGHISGKSVKDYCTRFWCHDIYEGDSQPNQALDSFYQTFMGRALGHQLSWNGYEHNAFFLNLGGKDFLNAAFLLGVAYEFDARAVVSDDLDGDGLQELLVVEYDAGEFQQRLHIAQNRAERSGNWIGVRLREHGDKSSPIGARVVVKSGNRSWVGRIVTGDSFTAQHANTIHIGIGPREQVDSIEIRWLDGKTRRLEDPAINAYHAVNR